MQGFRWKHLWPNYILELQDKGDYNQFVEKPNGVLQWQKRPFSASDLVSANECPAEQQPLGWCTLNTDFSKRVLHFLGDFQKWDVF